VSLTLEGPGGSLHEVLLEGGVHKFPWKLSPPGNSSHPVPLWLRDVGASYWTEPLLEANALYVQFNQVRDKEEESIEAFAGRIHETLASGDVKNLIVDVRHNNGGNNFLVRPMIRMMIAFEMASPEHRVYVLTGRNTFSAAQNFINRVDRYTDAIFAGERSSSRPNISGEENTLVLPYSGIRGSLSSRYWQDSDPTDHRQWIAPHIPVGLSSGEYFGNRDPVLEAVLEVIQRER
jgi:C-terminal processing protease CtpA/Prc